MFYCIEYSGINKVISISLETYENYVRVVIFKLDNGKLSDYVDKIKTNHLNQRTKEYFPKISKEEITAQVVNFVWNGLTDLKANPTLTTNKKTI